MGPFQARFANHPEKGRTMRLLTKCLLFLLFLMASIFAGAQRKDAADKSSDVASGSASKEEVEQLRQEVAAQRQTIEELKAMVQQLVQAKAEASNTEGGRVVNATLVQPDPQAAKSEQKAAEKPATPAPTAGWNGEHFFVKAGEFQLQPYGYFQSDFRT